MKDDTDIGGGDGRFPPTQRSAVLAVRSADPVVRRRAYDTLIRSYWKPAYKYVRLKWGASDDEAKDLTQGFLTRAIEKGVFDQYDASRAAFRTYLRSCLDGYVFNERKAGGRLKRGGDRVVLSLDFVGAEDEYRRGEPVDPRDPEAYFHREWVRSVFAEAVEALRTALEGSGRAVHFALFERYDLAGGKVESKLTYETLAREFALPVTQVTNYLAAARREFRGIVLEQLRAVTGNDTEFRDEARALLGTPV
ncbi:MAG: sigma-70 family RNA polymerase sigma factor [Phycisphaerales bacterium]|nr:sigma-70 family RNA polymerase sigma factor [Phycisphaerales bacterium]